MFYLHTDKYGILMNSIQDKNTQPMKGGVNYGTEERQTLCSLSSKLLH